MYGGLHCPQAYHIHIFIPAEELKILKNDKQVQKLEKDLDYERKKNNELLSKISVMAQHATR